MAALEIFGTTRNQREVHAATLQNGRFRARILTHGARLQMLTVGSGPNLCVSSDRIEDYEGALIYAGPIVAPVVNRIAGARAVLDGADLVFDVNEGDETCLHSGPTGAHAAVWEVADLSDTTVALDLHMPHHLGGFPGNRALRARYTLTSRALRLELVARTDAPTFMNPAHHGVWAANDPADGRSRRLEIPADTHLPTDAGKIPTGDVEPVLGTPYDHRQARMPDPSLDHNFCFSAPGLRARFWGAGGHVVEVWSDAPGMQAYAGDPKGVALEPQLWPDAPHHPHFPSIVLRPDETFRQTVDYVVRTG